MTTQIKEFYNKAEHGYEPDKGNNRHSLALNVFSRLDIKSIIDFGCGDGFFLTQIKKLKPDINTCGIEISGPAVNIARKNNIDVIEHDFSSGQTTVPADSFDACFMGEIIEHVFSTDDILLEASRVVKDGGWLFLTTPNLGSWFNRLSLLFGYQPIFTEVSAKSNAGHIVRLDGQPAGHIRIFTYRALKEVLERNNWIIEKTFGIGLNTDMHGGPSMIYRAINFIFSSPSISSGIGILARANKTKKP